KPGHSVPWGSTTPPGRPAWYGTRRASSGRGWESCGSPCLSILFSISHPPLVRPEQRLCEAAGLKEGEAQEHRVPHAPPDSAGNVVAAQGDTLHQHRVDAHADHNEERLEAQGQQGAEIVLPRVAPFPVHHRGKGDE